MKERRHIAAEIKASLHSSLFKLKHLYIVFQVILAIVLPILEAYIVNKYTGASEPVRNTLIPVLGIVVLMHLTIAIAIILIDSPAPLFYAYLDDVAKENRSLASLNTQLQSQLDGFMTIVEVINNNNSVLEIIRNDTATMYNHKNILDFLMLPWIEARCEIWGYQAKAIWNFVVYWVKDGDYNADEMNVLWRQHDNRLRKKDRVWKKGNGNIGRSWINGITSISPPDFIHSPERVVPCLCEDDDRYYQSVLATPIKLDDEIYGILVITSSVDAQFNEGEHGKAAECLGMILAQGLYQCKSDNALFKIKQQKNRKAKK